MDTQPLAVVHGKLREDMDGLQSFLDSGRCADFPEYKFVVGQIRGIRTAMQVTKDLADTMEGADND